MSWTPNPSWDLNAIWRPPRASWGPQMLAENPQNQHCVGTSSKIWGPQHQLACPTLAGLPNAGWGLSVSSRDPPCWLGIPSDIWGPPKLSGPPSNVSWSPQYWLPNAIQDCEQELNPQFRLGPQFQL